MRIPDLVGSHKPWTNWPKAVGTLALHPLAGPFHLERALRQVINHAVASHVIHSLSLFDIFSAGSDDDAKLDLPVALGSAPRQFHIVFGAADCGGRLHEKYRLLWNRHSCL